MFNTLESLMGSLPPERNLVRFDRKMAVIVITDSETHLSR